ncbi:tRNA pseudouridine(55) synthase TruB [Allobranchiibius sp. GilTou73]|uniref:tRNA pseudouridine(55) synthase TruB n=1 Tax=Allobranchiibius sp. GilTou73 TaxID=2904523 RepID=UPI001F18DC4E|nr:tRNA pseudouridine(55) synthase TruB [Allobranchiibius sp. GilTou73]UIJ36597.1 tRNA pseudouridine(55) synthase TruB [Allobranchiibius sp. GilTou73]
MDGLLLVDKPAGWTSHDVVARCRRLAGTRRVGHAGTLDPMATGLLLIGIGRATKLLTFLVGCDKTYTATVRLGQCTVTDDAEGDVVESLGARNVDPAELERAVASLTGDIEQVPSSVSAIKIDGVRSYARVRGGEEVALKARPVRVARFDVRAQRASAVDGLPVLDLDIEVQVSSGTYVRALARDLGADLGVGGHLTALRRTGVGRFDVTAADTLQDLTTLREEGAPLPVLPLAQAARGQFAVRELTADQERDLRHGKRIAHDGVRQDPVAGIGPAGDLVAILDESGDSTRSQVVFPPFEQV